MCAHRPLDLRELTAAVAIDDMDDTWDASRVITDPDGLISDCGNLVITIPMTSLFREGHRQVRLLHTSVRDFLTANNPQVLQEAHFSDFFCYPFQEASVVLSQTCFKYFVLSAKCHIERGTEVVQPFIPADMESADEYASPSLTLHTYMRCFVDVHIRQARAKGALLITQFADTVELLATELNLPVYARNTPSKPPRY